MCIINVKFSKVTHYEILSEDFFGEFYDTFFDCPHSIYTSVSEDDSSLDYSSDSDDVNIRPTKRQKKLKIGSERERESETHGAGECSCTSIQELTEDNISWKSEDFTGLSDVTTECNNLQSVSERKELIWGQPK